MDAKGERIERHWIKVEEMFGDARAVSSEKFNSLDHLLKIHRDESPPSPPHTQASAQLLHVHRMPAAWGAMLDEIVRRREFVRVSSREFKTWPKFSADSAARKNAGAKLSEPLLLRCLAFQHHDQPVRNLARRRGRVLTSIHSTMLEGDQAAGSAASQTHSNHSISKLIATIVKMSIQVDTTLADFERILMKSGFSEKMPRLQEENARLRLGGAARSLVDDQSQTHISRSPSSGQDAFSAHQETASLRKRLLESEARCQGAERRFHEMEARLFSARAGQLVPGSVLPATVSENATAAKSEDDDWQAGLALEMGNASEHSSYNPGSGSGLESILMEAQSRADAAEARVLLSKEGTDTIQNRRSPERSDDAQQPEGACRCAQSGRTSQFTGSDPPTECKKRVDPKGRSLETPDGARNPEGASRQACRGQSASSDPRTERGKRVASRVTFHERATARKDAGQKHQTVRDSQRERVDKYLAAAQVGQRVPIRPPNGGSVSPATVPENVTAFDSEDGLGSWPGAQNGK
ncbi:hypothetical protein DFJ77DRAFT_513475 [Powellomyces hirtus]|nr:hypothetical protein DFJ77DRAFT_513475 [Powellomyces hirtus]